MKESETPLGQSGNLRSGFSTGACAAAAAKAAAHLLCRGEVLAEVEILLPGGLPVSFGVVSASSDGVRATAAVRKDAGDDPDITGGLLIVSSVEFFGEGDVVFVAGEGVGMVTKPGLSISPGEPAINPVPRSLIRGAIREITSQPVRVTVSIPGGEELAKKTFNPRLGIVGGLSVLGTTGIVRPFSLPALQASLVCALDVAAASGVQVPVLVPGNIGERAARRHLDCAPEAIVQVSNFWGFLLDEAARRSFSDLWMVGHPGKLAKLVDGEWDTHSSSSASAVATVAGFAGLPESEEYATVEGVFASLTASHSRVTGDLLAEAIRHSVLRRTADRWALSVLLINMGGAILGTAGQCPGLRGGGRI